MSARRPTRPIKAPFDRVNLHHQLLVKPTPWFVCAVLFAATHAILCASDIALARQNLDGLRGIQLPKGPESHAQIETLNKRMDAAWGFFESHKDSLAFVEEELRMESGAREPDQFFLLDVGHLLLTYEGADAALLSLSALERIDPKAEIIRSNWEELFHFAMKIGATGKDTDRYLVQMDRIYLPNETGVNFVQTPHVVKLTPDDIRCMVYGVGGQSAASHLCGLLKIPGSDRERIVPILNAVGSEENTPAVKAVLNATSDFKLISPCIYFLMEVGGPSGRAAVLGIDPSNVDAETKAYLSRMRPEVEKVSFPAFLEALSKIDPRTVGDSELQRLLDRMEERNGEDSETPPGAVLKSGIPKGTLLAQMKRIRARSFRRETNHVFEDLPVTNALINALQFE
jgi:hypothetical protein